MAPPRDQEEARERLERLAWLLDSSIPLPVGGWRIGLDSVAGLIPGIGDAAGALVSLYIVVEAWRLGVSKRTLVRMSLNVLVEVVVGLVPIAGDIFDMAFKANQRNVRLIRRSIDDPSETARRSGLFLAILLIGLLAAASLVMAAGALLVLGLWALLVG